MPVENTANSSHGPQTPPVPPARRSPVFLAGPPDAKICQRYGGTRRTPAVCSVGRRRRRRVPRRPAEAPRRRLRRGRHAVVSALPSLPACPSLVLVVGLASLPPAPGPAEAKPCWRYTALCCDVLCSARAGLIRTMCHGVEAGLPAGPTRLCPYIAAGAPTHTDTRTPVASRAPVCSVPHP